MNRVLPAQTRPDERGIALPLALLGLVAVTLLVTTALVTGSTESAISTAQQDAAQRLYTADAGIELYLRQRMELAASGAETKPLRPRRDSVTVNGRRVVIDVSRLRRSQIRIPAVIDANGIVRTPEQFRRTETYSLLAQPRPGGRAVGAMYTTGLQWSTANLNINSAGAVAAQVLRIPGNSGAMSGRDQSGCADINDGTTGGSNALAVSDSVTLELDTARVLESAGGYSRVERTGLTRADFAAQVLGGMSPEDMARTATIRWGDSLPAPGGGTSNGTPITQNQIMPSAQHARPDPRNWGCPNTPAKLEGREGTVNCPSLGDTAFYPVIAVRAPNVDNFKIQGHGQGILIVLGSVDLRDLNFFGVVVVTGNVDLNGTGYIGGAFVALGNATLGRDPNSSEVEWNGRTFVRFNRCGLNAAQTALAGGGEAAAVQSFTNRSLSWFEVIR